MWLYVTTKNWILFTTNFWRKTWKKEQKKKLKQEEKNLSFFINDYQKLKLIFIEKFLSRIYKQYSFLIYKWKKVAVNASGKKEASICFYEHNTGIA